MKALLAVLSLLIASVAQAGGGNFVTDTNRSGERAKELVNRAEFVRQAMSIAWFGREKPAWDEKCELIWSRRSGLASGETLYNNSGNRPLDMTMTVQGSFKSIWMDAIPHEVFHLLLHDHLGFTPPLWMNEGASSTCESDTLMTNYEERLKRYIELGRIPHLKHMLSVDNYPQDVLPFYAQGISVSRWLLALRGPEKFCDLAQEHHRSGDWETAFKLIYEFKSLDSANTQWREWVADGCPQIKRVAKEIPRSQAPYRPNQLAAPDP